MVRSLAELVQRWGRRRRLSDAQARLAVDEWRGVLGVRHGVRLERIRHYEVTNERGRLGCSLVGVVCDAEAACIYHTRALTTEDLIHELLHVVQPSWREEEVVRETERLLQQARELLLTQREGSAERLPLLAPGAQEGVGEQQSS
jgi:hypothetical protein